MASALQKDDVSRNQHVLVSNTAANMISSLHPHDKRKTDALLARIRSSVLDPAMAQKIVGIENAFVTRAGDLRVVFRKEGDSLVITSVVARD